jgi:deazaflavin-dependent oxidoreductase (nitroreductase family)
MARQFRKTWLRDVANRVITLALKVGLGPRTARLLTVTGRRTGLPRTTPVSLVQRGDAWYLVAPYGDVSWVKNARVAGEVTLSRGRTSEVRAIEEVRAAESVPVLRDYWRQNAITRPYFDAKSEDDVGAFLREASHHPVFRLA